MLLHDSKQYHDNHDACEPMHLHAASHWLVSVRNVGMQMLRCKVKEHGAVRST